MRKGFVVLSLLCAMNVSANEISFFDWGVYLDGNVNRSTADLPGNITFSNGFFETGLGTVTMSFESAIPVDHSIAMFFDYEIDEQVNTFYNEYGTAGGIPVDPRLLYEIDEPGFGTDDAYRETPKGYNYIGDIYDNFTDFSNRGFDGKTFYDEYTGTNLSDYENLISDDVSMAMGWNFSLNADETAVLQYTVSTSAPASGFYLAQMDRNTAGREIYLQSRLDISPVAVPEPGIMSLLGIGLLFLCLVRKRQGKKTSY